MTQERELRFPAGTNETWDKEPGSDNEAIQIFGRRIYADQSLYEYLIEFLLVFISPKRLGDPVDQYAMAFHPNGFEEAFCYYAKPRIGLKRFIFYEWAKREGRTEVDGNAYAAMCTMLEGQLAESADEFLAKEMRCALQDLLYGYAAVLKNRSWMAQCLLPIAPELVFPEAMPNKKKRKGWNANSNTAPTPKEVETEFDFKRHNFLARGGEVYYLHLLQGLSLYPELRQRLEALLNHLLTARSRRFSKLANWLQISWERKQGIELEALVVEMPLGFIPAAGYKECVKNSIEELSLFLSNELHPLMRIELLSKGIVLHIMRMMARRAQEYQKKRPLYWIIDMRGKEGNASVKRLAAMSFKGVEESLTSAVQQLLAEKEIDGADAVKKVKEAREHTLNMFRRLGKEMQLIIPLKGAMERFSLSEELVRFLVLAIVPPKQKMQLDLFLQKLYEGYGIVIGPEEYRRCALEAGHALELADCFRENANAFQGFLKQAGFLRALSDATAIVVNPFEEVVLK